MEDFCLTFAPDRACSACILARSLRAFHPATGCAERTAGLPLLCGNGCAVIICMVDDAGGVRFSIHSGLAQYCGRLRRLLVLGVFRMLSGGPPAPSRALCLAPSDSLKSAV